MGRIKQISSFQVLSFVYDTQELRNAHVDMMKKEGWQVAPITRRLRDGLDMEDLAETKDEDYEPFAKFIKGELK